MRLSNVVYPFNISFSTGVAVVAMLGLAPLLGWALGGEQWLVVASLGLIALTPVVIRWPVVSAFGAYAFLATSFDSIALLQGAATLTRPAGILAGGVLLVAGLMERRLARPPRAAFWFGLFMLWASISAVWALDVEMLAFTLRMALNLFILYLAAVLFKPSRKELYGVCVLIVLGGVTAAAAGYMFGLEDGGHQGRGRIVIEDRDSNPNALGRSLLLPLSLAIAGFLGSRGTVRKAAAAACVGVIGVGVYISMSRGALVAMMATIAVLLYRTRARKEIIAVTLVLFALTATMPQQFYDRVTSVVTGEDGTGAGRTGLWALGLDAAVGGFGLFGAGFGNFPAVYKQYVLSDHPGFGVHNAYLSLWVEVGIVGLALMLTVFGSHLLAARRARPGQGGLVLAAAEAACVGVLASIMFGDYLWVKSFWLPWILLTWAIHCERQSAEAGNQAGLRVC